MSKSNPRRGPAERALHPLAVVAGEGPSGEESSGDFLGLVAVFARLGCAVPGPPTRSGSQAMQGIRAGPHRPAIQKGRPTEAVRNLM